MIAPGDLVLEPSAGTGLLAALARADGAGLVLNELADLRAELLGHLFEPMAVTRHDAALIHDLLDPGIAPTVVLMNPPFHVGKEVVMDVPGAFLAAAHTRLRPGGVLVLVANRALPYERELRGFRSLETLLTDPRFKVLRAVR